MSRKIILLLSIASLALIAVITISCGSSSSSTSTTCKGGPYDIVGNWQVTLTSSGGSDTLYGAIDSAGLAMAFDNNAAQQSTGDTIELPPLTGACSFSGTVNAYAEPTAVAQSPLALNATGNVTSATTITGSYSGPATGTFTAASFKPLTGSVSALSGNVTGEAEGAPNGTPILYPFTFTPTAVGTNSNMSFTTSLATSPNCTVSGTFTQVTTANVFDVSITFAGTACALTGTFTGLGFESSTDYFGFTTGTSATGPYLYADILASSNTFVMEFWVPKP